MASAALIAFCAVAVLFGCLMEGCGTPRSYRSGKVMVVQGPRIKNMRDFGGWIGHDGRKVRMGRIYRSGALNGSYRRWYRPRWTIPGRSRRYLANRLGVRTDIDLRSDAECVGMKRSPIGKGVAWRHIPSYGYDQLATEYGRDAFAKVFRVFLDESNYPILFHCKLGRDRAGAVAFMLNALLGVDEQDLRYDWEFSERSRGNDTFDYTRIDGLIDVFTPYRGDTLNEKVASYVKSLGFSDADIEHFCELVLDPGIAQPVTSASWQAPLRRLSSTWPYPSLRPLPSRSRQARQVPDRHCRIQLT